MSNIKFHTNRQVALQMAIEETNRAMGGLGTIKNVMSNADVFYEWLQNAPMKDEDQKHWITDPIIRTKDKK
jgi:hypothetical protein